MKGFGDQPAESSRRSFDSAALRSGWQWPFTWDWRPKKNSRNPFGLRLFF